MNKYIVALVILIASAVIWWQLMYPSGTWRYRLTLEVETPEGPKMGSSVIEVNVFDGPHLNPEGASMWKVRGEAVAVDLGPRGVLFALLGSERSIDYPVYVVFETFPWPGGPGGEVTKKGRAYYQTLTGKADLPVERLPILARFRDKNDPRTIVKINPNNLAAEFGAGVRLLKATIEMTKEPVTRQIVSKLVWLPNLAKNGGGLDGTRFSGSNELSSVTGAMSFER